MKLRQTEIAELEILNSSLKSVKNLSDLDSLLIEAKKGGYRLYTKRTNSAVQCFTANRYDSNKAEYLICGGAGTYGKSLFSNLHRNIYFTMM